ncbi:hypothetical protein LWI29_022997 [Acer saccharum]|uniref:Uncharacterized protein n=1 Tax=Acer saccharum TaxID=4024 RepID=A0AA39VXX8_ACESA|nr:hypothetical protein LWI29_022997 [Acer saccharum]
MGAENDNKGVTGMPSYGSPLPTSNQIGTEGNAIRSSQISDFRTLEQSLGFHIEDAVDLSRNREFYQMKSSSQAVGTDFQFGVVNKALASSNINLSTSIVGSQSLPLQKEPHHNLVSVSSGHRENWGESNMAEASPRTDTSTDDTEDKNQRFERGQSLAVVGSDSSDKSKEKTGDQKTLRRLAQNREAARKSRLRKKAYVQQLESSRLKLTQLEQELQRARQQGIFISSSGDQSHSMSGNGALAFDVEYARWLEEHNRHVNELRAAVNSHAGMWKTPAERCFMWIGGFRSSELLKLLVNQLEPLTEQQLVAIYNLQQSSQQAEDALSQGMDALQQSLAEHWPMAHPAHQEHLGMLQTIWAKWPWQWESLELSKGSLDRLIICGSKLYNKCILISCVTIQTSEPHIKASKSSSCAVAAAQSNSGTEIDTFGLTFFSCFRSLSKGLKS